MRIWSIHPSYLDAQGLVALWRETLLAQKVLMGKTRGYKNHPQLIRFKEHPDPLGAIAFYLWGVHKESEQRSYIFDAQKINQKMKKITAIKVTKGQCDFEITHLCRKLKIRDPQQLKVVRAIKKTKPHPLFKLTSGDVAPWEKGEPVAV